MQYSRLHLASTAFFFSACATTAPETAGLAPVGPGPTPIEVSPPAPVAAPAPPPPPTCDIFVKPGVLKRASLIRLIDAGLARWLQGVEGDRALANHRFAGWVVKSLHSGDPCYQDVDLRQGDVVQKVNGKSIEKPEQAFDVLESLRVAPAIVVEYLRDGKPRQFTIPISEEP
jgi:S1-C subfamily serine protease